MAFLCLEEIYPVKCPSYSYSDGTASVTHFCWVPEDSVWGLVGLGHVTALVFLLSLCQFFCSSNRASREATMTERRFNWLSVCLAAPWCTHYVSSFSQPRRPWGRRKWESFPACLVLCFPGVWRTATMATPNLSNEHPKFQEAMQHKLVKISGKNSGVLAISRGQAVAARERVFDKPKSSS